MAFANEQDSTLPEAPETEASETEETEGAETEQEAEGLLGEGEGEGEGEQEAAAAVDLEEIEFDGERYAVPAKLKSAFMMQSDYTRKTQEVADARKQVEAVQKSLVAYEKSIQEDVASRAKLANIDEQIARYAAYTPEQWQAVWEQNPADHDKHRWYFQSLKEQRNELNSKLENAARERSENAQREHATRVAKTLGELQRDIKGWGPELANALTDYGMTQGYTRDELTAIVDSRAIKVLHKAHLYDQLIAKQKGTAPRVQPNPSAVVKPLTQVSKGASRPAVTAAPSDRDSDEEWMRKRNAQLRKKSA